jgi:hypothetical protein
VTDKADKAPFAVNVTEPIQWGAAKPLTRDGLLAAAKAMADQEDRDRHKRRVHYVSPHEFEEYVAAGIIDREGNLL